MLSVKKLSVVFFLSALILAGCSKKNENNPVGPDNGNGGVTAQAQLSLNGTQYSSSTGASFYVSSESLTYASFWSGNSSDSLSVTIIFPGQQKGTFNWDANTNGVYIISGTGDNAKIYMSGESGTTTVNSYGEVNQSIAGSFTGTLYEISSGDSVQVNSNFSIVRIPDQSE